MKTGRRSIVLCFSVLTTIFSASLSTAYSPLFSARSATTASKKLSSPWDTISLPRGGDQSKPNHHPTPETKKQGRLLGAMTFSTYFASIGESYSRQLSIHPIATKSLTAGFVFVLSDYLAQLIERKKEKDPSTVPLNKSRLLGSLLVGLCYFGPAAHYWYEMIFKLLPGTGLISTLEKAVLGQLIFGPSFTCIFFAVGLIQSNEFTFSKWFTKIKEDLPGAWLAGVGFWPLVDIISYSVIPVKWIPLFVNFASLIWTIYLSLVSNKTPPGELVPTHDASE